MLTLTNLKNSLNLKGSIKKTKINNTKKKKLTKSFTQKKGKKDRLLIFAEFIIPFELPYLCKKTKWKKIIIKINTGKEKWIKKKNFKEKEFK